MTPAPISGQLGLTGQPAGRPGERPEALTFSGAPGDRAGGPGGGLAGSG